MHFAIQEMASEERKAADKKIQEENLFKSLSAAEKQAETDAFQCSRCKQVCRQINESSICFLTTKLVEVRVSPATDAQCRRTDDGTFFLQPTFTKSTNFLPSRPLSRMSPIIHITV